MKIALARALGVAVVLAVAHSSTAQPIELVTLRAASPTPSWSRTQATEAVTCTHSSSGASSCACIRTAYPSPAAQLFLDIQNLVTAGGERGLLALAFHPDFATNGVLLRQLQRAGAGGPAVLPAAGERRRLQSENSVIARFRVQSFVDPENGDPNFADFLRPGATHLPLTTSRSPTHNFGDLRFGPDGDLLHRQWRRRDG